MQKNYYLSPTEQDIFDLARDSEMIHIKDIIEAMRGYTEPQVVRNSFSSLVKKGRIYRIKRGIYLKAEEGNPIIPDPLMLGNTIFKGYIAFSSALRHYDLIEYEPFTVFVATKSRSKSVEVGEYTFKAVSLGERAEGFVKAKNYYVSTLEKTIFDCLYKPEHAGGYPATIRAISEADPDWKTIIAYFRKYASDSLFQRSGYALSKAENTPQWVLNEMKKHVRSRTWLIPKGIRRGKFNNEWNILDNGGVWYE